MSSKLLSWIGVYTSQASKLALLERVRNSFGVSYGNGYTTIDHSIGIPSVDEQTTLRGKFYDATETNKQTGGLDKKITPTSKGIQPMYKNRDWICMGCWSKSIQIHYSVCWRAPHRSLNISDWTWSPYPGCWRSCNHLWTWHTPLFKIQSALLWSTNLTSLHRFFKPPDESVERLDTSWSSTVQTSTWHHHHHHHHRHPFQNLPKPIGQ